MKKNVIKNYDSSLDDLIKAFLIKQGYTEDDDGKIALEYEFISEDAPDIVCVSDWFINISDIYYDMSHNVEAGKIFEWQDYNLSYGTNGYRYVNYRSYLLGYRHKNRTKFQDVVYYTKEWLERKWFYLRYLRSNLKTRKMMRQRFKEIDLEIKPVSYKNA